MAITCEFIDIIVPIEKIDAKYPGGFSAFKRANESLFGGRLWHDDHLFRDGAMSPQDAAEEVRFWEGFGLTGIASAEDGEKHWQDICVVESMFRGPTLPCDWIEFDREQRCVWLRGHERGEICGRWTFSDENGASSGSGSQ
jgi:hypothetical protein